MELYTTTLPNTQKTLHYVAENVPDFAFFADKNYAMQYDTVVLPSGKVVDAFSFFSHCVDQKAKFAAQYECRWDLSEN